MCEAEASELFLREIVEHLLGFLIHDAELGFFGGEFRVEVGRVFGVFDSGLERRDHFPRFEILPIDLVEKGVTTNGTRGAIGHAQSLGGLPMQE